MLKKLICIASCFLFLGGLKAQNVHPDYLDGALYVEFKATSGLKAEFNAKDLDIIATEKLPALKNTSSEIKFQEYAYPLAIKGSHALDQCFTIYLEDPTQIDRAIRELQNNPDVALVEKVPYYTLLSQQPATPNDPFYGSVDGLNLKWHLDLIHAEQAWELQKADSNVIIAIVDQAIWGEHEDLQIPSRRQFNISNPALNSSRPPEDVEQDQLCTKDEISNGYCYSYRWTHGTHVAGLVGAKNDNGIGIRSLGSGLGLMAVSCPNMDYTSGVRMAFNNGARIINCSWGSWGYSSTAQKLVNEIHAQGGVVVAAAGDNGDADRFVYPAAYENVISVTSCNANKQKTGLANCGYWVDIVAPGGFGTQDYEMIFSTTFSLNQLLRLEDFEGFDGKYYDMMYGTSMATPLVSALCGLLLSKDASMTADDLLEILAATSQKNDQLGVHSYTGIIDAPAAIKAVDNRVKRHNIDYIEYFTGVSEYMDAELVWKLKDDIDPADRPEKFHIYRNGEKIAELDGSVYKYVDLHPLLGGYNRYDICGVHNGVESHRKNLNVLIGSYYEVRASAVPAEGGWIEGTGFYPARGLVALTAIPNNGYVFDHWEWLDRWVNEPWINDPRIEFQVDNEFLGIKAFFRSASANAETLSSQDIQLYPNPCKDQLYLKSSLKIERIAIYELNGKLIQEVNRPSSSLSVSDLEKGIYLIKIVTEKGCLIEKFIKQ